MRLRKILVAGAAAIAATTLVASPAAAAVNDSFSVWTGNGGCGMVEFVDYANGNDDYLIIHDYCGDGHGVRAWAWLTEQTTQGPLEFSLGSKYNGNGQAGAAVTWDPFVPYGNVVGGDKVRLRVCLVDGSGDTSGSSCGNGSRTSRDG